MDIGRYVESQMVTLSNLTYKDFERWQAWRVIENTYQDEDISLQPARLDELGLIDKRNGEVWCLCKAVFACGEKHKASGMCRGDSSDGPFLLTISNGVEDVTLIQPPAPDFVLQAEGAEQFSKRFDKKLNEVFPLTIKVIPHFQLEPKERYVVIGL